MLSEPKWRRSSKRTLVLPESMRDDPVAVKAAVRDVPPWLPRRTRRECRGRGRPDACLLGAMGQSRGERVSVLAFVLYASVYRSGRAVSLCVSCERPLSCTPAARGDLASIRQ